MQNILTQERLQELLHYDAETGVFTWRVDRYCVKAGSVAGSIHKRTGYCAIRVDFVSYRAHRLAWLYVYGCWPSKQIDHKNRARHDNGLSNLRDVTGLVNQQNRTLALGVTQRSPGSFEARIRKQGKPLHLGNFPTLDAASAAYVAAKTSYMQEIGAAA